ncbi:MAG: PilN domain-containing protein [Nitrospiraceae bacterium]|nr:PilN domain-containing protein [Nitrospiraceae bacterium]
MIRVNLLSVKRKKKAQALPSFIIYGALLLVAAIIVAGYSVWYLNSQVSRLSDQKKSNEVQIAELKKKIKEVENYESQKKLLEQKTNVIKDLKKNQSLPAKILSEINNTIPQGVWITALSISGANINISGAGFTNDDIINYVDNLKKSQLFTDIYLQGSQKDKGAAGKTASYQFTLTCKVKI